MWYSKPVSVLVKGTVLSKCCEGTSSIVKEVWAITFIRSRGLGKAIESHKTKIKEVSWAQSLEDLNIMAWKKLGFPSGASGKESTCRCRRHRRRGFDPCIGKISWRRKWQPTLVFLPGKFHGHRSLAVRLQSVRSQRVGHSFVTTEHY